MSKIEFSESQIEKIEKMFFDNLPYCSIAKELNVSTTKIFNTVKNLNLKREKVYPIKKNISDEQIEEMKKMYINGMNYVEIAKSFNESLCVVRNRLFNFVKNYEKKFFYEYVTNENQLKEIREMHIQGKSLKFISKKYNIPLKILRKFIDRII